MQRGIIILLCLLGFSAISQAAPKLEATHDDWSAYSRTEGGDKICYVLSAPETKSPNSVNHGDIYFMVASWKSGAATEQPSFIADYPLKTNSPPISKVGSGKYPMFVSQNEAFIENRAEEQSLISAMRAGSTLRVEAMSQRGTAVSYGFSLMGITAALRSARQACQ